MQVKKMNEIAELKVKEEKKKLESEVNLFPFVLPLGLQGTSGTLALLYCCLYFVYIYYFAIEKKESEVNFCTSDGKSFLFYGFREL
jgi:hypothetical protein